MEATTFVGLDVHKRTTSVAIAEPGRVGEVRFLGEIPSTPGLKDGRTRLAYKPEHAVDLDTGAILAAEVHPGDAGDTQTLEDTLEVAATNRGSQAGAHARQRGRGRRQGLPTPGRS
jgi:hypothetical protein